MADPMTIVGLAANIAQFIGYGLTLLAKSKEIHQSATGASRDVIDVEIIAQDLSAVLVRLKTYEAKRSGVAPLDKLREGCMIVIKELLKVVEEVRVKGRKSRWKSFKVAVKFLGKKDKIEEWMGKLADFREQFNVHVEVYILENIDLLALKQDEGFKKLDAYQQHLVRVVQDAISSDTEVFEQLLADKTNILSETVHKEHKKTREAIKDAASETRQTISTSAMEMTDMIRESDGILHDRLTTMERTQLTSLERVEQTRFNSFERFKQKIPEQILEDVQMELMTTEINIENASTRQLQRHQQILLEQSHAPHRRTEVVVPEAWVDPREADPWNVEHLLRNNIDISFRRTLGRPTEEDHLVIQGLSGVTSTRYPHDDWSRTFMEDDGPWIAKAHDSESSVLMQTYNTSSLVNEFNKAYPATTEREKNDEDRKDDDRTREQPVKLQRVQERCQLSQPREYITPGKTNKSMNSRYPCPEPGCAVALTWQKDINRHKRIRHGPEEYKCRHCQRSFSRNDNLSRHTRAQHNPHFKADRAAALSQDSALQTDNATNPVEDFHKGDLVVTGSSQSEDDGEGISENTRTRSETDENLTTSRKVPRLVPSTSSNLPPRPSIKPPWERRARFRPSKANPVLYEVGDRVHVKDSPRMDILFVTAKARSPDSVAWVYTLSDGKEYSAGELLDSIRIGRAQAMLCATGS